MCAGTMGCCTCPMPLQHPSHGAQLHYAMELCYGTMGMCLLTAAGTMGCYTCPMSLQHPSHGALLWYHGNVSINGCRYHGLLHLSHVSPASIPWVLAAGSWYYIFNILWIPWACTIVQWECVG